MNVRRATAEDRVLAVRTATRAFANDPLIRWLFPDDATYEDDAGRFFQLQFELRVEGGEVWVTDDVVAVAMWDAPGGSRKGQQWADATWQRGLARLTATARQNMGRLGRAMESLHLQDPHWYLGILATHPDWQRRGLGHALVGPVLASADADGLTTALLTESPENVAFYRGLGFTVVAEPEIEDGPPVWAMRRSPGAAQPAAPWSAASDEARSS